MCDFQFSGPVRAPGRNALLIHLLISALYTLFAWLPHLLPFFFIYFSLLIYFLTYEARSCFQATGRKRRPNLGVKFFKCILSYSISVFLMHGYFAL